ncbi:MAG: VanZ family protein [Pseudomonadota bacterium]|nr:hypothetical protein [Pseudomonadales bacterium]MDY6921676.1 VanZ family protein [Pseudomonadota bacterium]
MFFLPLTAHQITWLFRLALLVNLLVISWLAVTGAPLRVPAVLGDKVNHFAAFFVLAYCLDRGFPNHRFLLSKLWLLLAYGAAIELVQSRLPHRDFSLLDLAVDALAIGCYWVLRGRLRRLLLPPSERV